MKTHKKDLNCGTPLKWNQNTHKNTAEKDNEVTCKKCLRLINDAKSEKLYKVSYFTFDDSEGCQIVKAATASKAIYKCFKLFRYDDEYCENIGIQFQWFRRGKPKAKLIKDANAKPTMTWFEEQEFNKNEAIKRADEFNCNYPIGTRVLFQGDGKNSPIITTTRSKAQVYSDYLTIFLEGVSGSYLLDDRFIRVLTDENKDLKELRC